MNEPIPKAEIWWGEHDLAPNGTGYWRIGPLQLWISDRDHEWRLAFERGEDALDPLVRVDVPLPDSALVPSSAERTRMATHHTAGTVKLLPALADRGVVTRPEIPFRVLPYDEVTIYVTSPIWLRVMAGEWHQHCLWDQPLLRPSDTWIGADTTSGRLAYASRTFLRLDPANVPVYPGRAVTRIYLHNLASTPLLLERLHLPVTELALYTDDDGRLMTEDITLKREPGGDLAAVRIEPGAPDGAVGAVRLMEPREVPRRGGLLQALSSLFG